MQTNEKIRVLGLMSGTSLDGLDLALCDFECVEGNWKFQIMHAETIEYPKEWIERLLSMPSATAAKFAETDHQLGQWFGMEAKKFCDRSNIFPDFVSSHGHTIFHQPHLGFTSQIGHGAGIYAQTGWPVVYDFRSVDVAFGGQGAPLVPVGDQLLFSQYSFCLNLGGIANISFGWNSQRYAFDICPVNQVLNSLSSKLGHPFDKNGDLARQGLADKNLLNKLNSLEFYTQPYPKSLGREWVEHTIFPLLSESNLTIKDLLATFTEHVAIQIAKVANESPVNSPQKRILVTGGGTFNQFLIE
ncbi:MAG: anhydro-N-acetylmuramic acid kinase, partial [Cytophagales bacterium]|nr:anhydro-N-acetylmuramic acid kinase [Cytophagales bacterium]